MTSIVIIYVTMLVSTKYYKQKNLNKIYFKKLILLYLWAIKVQCLSYYNLTKCIQTNDSSLFSNPVYDPV